MVPNEFKLDFTRLFTVKHVHTKKSVIIEGKLRCQELREHLVKHNSDMAVYLSEDASGMISRITYDPKTNQMVGLVLPFDENGMPKTMSFTPDSAQEIEDFMKLEQSTLVYIMIAQPLVPNIPSFILHIFGTNNKFTKQDVLRRWAHVQQELER